MAVEQKFNIKTEADTTEVDKLVSKLDELIEAQQQGQKEAEDLNKKTKEVGESSKKTGKAAKAAGKGFKALGGALKAAGIGLAIAAVAKLTQAFGQNQQILDGVNKVMTTINIVFSEFVGAITEAVNKVSEATNGFEDTKKVVMGLMTLALTPLKLLFDGIKLTVQQAQLAWEKSFFGDDDPKTIKRLQKDIKETKESIKETGKEAAQSGKDVVSGYGGMVDEFGQLAKTTAENTKKINADAAADQADRLVQLRKEIKLAESELQGLTLKFTKQAEDQRQIRDDTRKSIEERIKANDKLGKILQKQAQEELAIANKRVMLAREELKTNPENIEKKKALKDALNGVAEVEERINGIKSEQKTNEAALQEERRANLAELEKIGLSEVELAKKESEQKLNDQKRLIEKTVSNKEEQDRLIEKAEKQHQERLNKIDQERKEKEKEERLKEQEKALEQYELDKEFEQLQFQEKRERLKEQEQAIKNDKLLTEKQRLAALKEIHNKEAQLEQQKRQQRRATVDNLITLAGQETKVGKALLIAKQALAVKEMFLEIKKTIAFSKMAVAKSKVAVAEGSAQTAKIGFPQNIPLLIGYAVQAAAIFSSVKSAVKGISGVEGVGNIGGAGTAGGTDSVPKTSGGGSGTATQAATAATSPSFNVVQGSQQNQLLGDVSEGVNRPTRAYVVGKDVSTQQEADRNRVSNAKLAG